MLARRLATLCLCMFFSGCSGSNGAGTGKAGAGPEAITIAQFGHVFLYMPLYVAVDKGFFKEQGLDARLVSTGGDEKTFAAVSSGNAQFGVSDPTFAAIARQRGQGGKVVAGIVHGTPFWMVTFKESIKPIRNPKDFDGLRIATYTAPSTSYAVMKDVLQNHGHPVKGKIVEGAFGTLIAMLKANQADMAEEIEPVVSIACKQGAKIVYSPSKELGDFAFTGLTVSDQFYKENPETIQKAVAAIAKAMLYIQSDFDGAVAVAQKEFPDIPPDVARSALTRLRDEGTMPKSPLLPKEAWDNAIRLRRELGDITASNGKFDDNVDMRFVQQANKDK